MADFNLRIRSNGAGDLIEGTPEALTTLSNMLIKARTGDPQTITSGALSLTVRRLAGEDDG